MVNIFLIVHVYVSNWLPFLPSQYNDDPLLRRYMKYRRNSPKPRDCCGHYPVCRRRRNSTCFAATSLSIGLRLLALAWWRRWLLWWRRYCWWWRLLYRPRSQPSRLLPVANSVWNSGRRSPSSTWTRLSLLTASWRLYPFPSSGLPISLLLSVLCLLFSSRCCSADAGNFSTLILDIVSISCDPSALQLSFPTLQRKMRKM